MDNFINDQERAAADENEAGLKTKKSLALIIIEIILLLFVIALAIIFFSRRNSTGTQTNNSEVVSTPISSPTVNNPATAENTANSGTTGAAGSAGTTNTKIIKTSEAENLRMSLPVPAQSGVADEASIPAGAIKISGTANGFEPKEFTVKAGEEITLALISRIDLPVVLTFYDPNMAAIAIGCGPREARWVSFKAPTIPGEYIFKNDVIGHSQETGKMIVK